MSEILGKYRKRIVDAEAERVRLRARVDVLEREVARMTPLETENKHIRQIADRLAQELAAMMQARDHALAQLQEREDELTATRSPRWDPDV